MSWDDNGHAFAGYETKKYRESYKLDKEHDIVAALGAKSNEVSEVERLLKLNSSEGMTGRS